jgi:hypothetical protein
VREPKRIRFDALLDHFAHVRRGAEESIRWHESFDALMRPMEVVRVDVETESTFAIREIREDRSRQKLFPQRLPEAFDLAERLRMLRSTLDVPDALSAKLLFEVGLTTPCRVLPALVGEDLSRRAVRRNSAAKSLHHELGFLVVCEREGHDEARVIVHESGQVQALLTAEQKREDVGLPELIRLRAFEAPLTMLALRSRLPSLYQALLMQDPSHD